ncbi:MAG: conjugal transfer protein TraX [Lachnospiraceae bacterium]|nr:conjugal transfer protein TraX [Lachnospiraceae bacterium]
MDRLVVKWNTFVEKHGLSGSTLKMIAYVLMIIDHSAAMLVMPYIEQNVGNIPYERLAFLLNLHDIMRKVGRIAFPIFCFLLVEGYVHTKNIYKYEASILVTALVSEPFFDLALHRQPIYWGYQNVCFTLFVCLVVVHVVDKCVLKSDYNIFLKMLIFAAATCGSMQLLYLMKTDYSYKGVFAVTLMFLFRMIRPVALFAGEAIFDYEPTAFFSIIPLMLYNGKRGFKTKYLFYLVYPGHLFLIWLVSLKLL